ncbi:MAG: hypothetical protein Q9159_005934 [Coniocarpon cinnabarinum]
MSNLLASPKWRARPASSHTYLYPLQGVAYLTRNRFLWPLLRSRLLPVTILSTLAFIFLLTFAYLPQALLLAIFHGRAAFFNALILVLGEAAALTQLLFEAFFVDETLVDAFDATLVAEGQEHLLLKNRPVQPSSEGDPRQRLGRPTTSAVFAPFSFRQTIEFILLLPLTLIPWAGVPLFLWGTGYRAGPLLQYRYFVLKGFAKQEKREYIKNRRRSYTGFGITAITLQLVPMLSMAFLVTTAVGSAVWVTNMEREQAPRSDGTSIQHDGGYGATQQPSRAPNEQPPPYSEDDNV